MRGFFQHFAPCIFQRRFTICIFQILFPDRRVALDGNGIYRIFAIGGNNQGINRLDGSFARIIESTFVGLIFSRYRRRIISFFFNSTFSIEYFSNSMSLFYFLSGKQALDLEFTMSRNYMLK